MSARAGSTALTPSPRGAGVYSLTAVVAALLAAAVPGLLFEPVFGLRAVLVPIAVVLLACLLAVELCRRVAALGPWRPLLALLAGLLALAETQLRLTTAGGLPTAATVRALVAGATDSWQLTLQSTWPARPDAELLLFVPLAVLVAAVLGIELLRRPPAALLPSLLLLGLSQAYVALTGRAAIAAALGYACVAAALLVVSKQDSGAVRSGTRATAVLLVLPTVVLGVAAAIVTVAADPVRQPAYSLRQNSSVPLPATSLRNPLEEVAARLRQPDTPVFSYRATSQVDRWRLVVLSSFDGVSWKPDPRYRRMGATVDLASTVTAPTDERSAQVTVPDTDLPWVPSQALPDAVSGLAPLIDQESGMLMAQDRTGPVRYDLRWREPRVDAGALFGAPIDSTAATGLAGLGQVPPDVRELASKAVGGLRPSFQTALALEDYLSQNYRVATGTDLPTGSGWPQLRTFLLDSKRGTSEQFAAAYVALARLQGIPARLVVGFSVPPASGGDVVVRNGNVLVWPEVPVTGIGWVPLDPIGTAAGSGAPTGGLAEATAKARANLPPPRDRQNPPLLPRDQDAAGDGPGSSFSVPVVPILLSLLVLAVLVAVGVPLFRAVRARRRRRLTGVRGVVAAWWEARDRLRANGVPFTAGMTVRDLATAAGPDLDRSVVDGLHMLARLVDSALWSGMDTSGYATDEAWLAVKVIDTGLTGRPVTQRIRATFDPRSLFPPRAAAPTLPVPA